MQHFISYDLARGLHVIAVIAWISGLLMLPRFYHHIAASKAGGELEQALLKAARSVRAIVLSPALVSSWVFGLFLLATYLAPDWRALPRASFIAIPHWFWTKLALVVALTGYHVFLFSEGRKLAAGLRPHSERFWSMMSAAPFVVAIAIVLLATVEP